MNETCIKENEGLVPTSSPECLNIEFNPDNPLPDQSEKPIKASLEKNTMTARPFLVLLGAFWGSVFGWQNEPHSWPFSLACGLSGGILGIGLIYLERLMRRFPSHIIIQTGKSIAIGIGLASLFTWLLTVIFPHSSAILSPIALACLLAFPYLSVAIRGREGESSPQQSSTFWPFETQQTDTIPPKVLDTSTIIDGRILDLYETGFLEGPIYIPRFVLQELHYIADSPQSWKRARGKRGLEILSQLQALPGIDLQITEIDFPHIPEVDHKLIKLAQHVHGKIATNDWNLAKIASVENIQTLNMNRLFHQLKPPVVPGEIIRVLINKEGDLAGQGVAHLDDGTMIVVDQARDYVQETVDVVITKFMQTQSGRILFGSRL